MKILPVLEISISLAMVLCKSDLHLLSEALLNPYGCLHSNWKVSRAAWIETLRLFVSLELLISPSSFSMLVVKYAIVGSIWTPPIDTNY